MTCCTPKGYDRLFGRRTARRDAKRYRRRGLDEDAARMVAFLRERGLEGATVLEIGGGVGAIEIELLAAGAERATITELSPSYEEPAAELAREHGLEERIERRLGDVVEDGALAGEADAVVMHRVVCCYPDPEALVGAAAERARRHLVLTFPREQRLIRAGAAVMNAAFRLLRWDYRTYIHPVATILAAAEGRGLRLADEHHGRFWQVAALERP
ncbi:MAG TPA: methyltransferase domain-containing protein [Gaiellaceae bacterium]|nr:methyltransferase domain-containing protein [Gaiellaceae bacterium]